MIIAWQLDELSPRDEPGDESRLVDGLETVPYAVKNEGRNSYGWKHRLHIRSMSMRRSAT